MPSSQTKIVERSFTSWGKHPYSLFWSPLTKRRLNFAFMIVQTAYGFTTGSLGLLSDSVHMLLDCMALGVGLCASVMSKWPPSVKFPYGLGKMDTLAGFANGIFLMYEFIDTNEDICSQFFRLISVEIVVEAAGRLAEPTEMRRMNELLVVSAAGLGVNLVGESSCICTSPKR